MSLSKQLAENIKTRRGELSQGQFAKKAGVSRATITRIENEAQNVTIQTLETLTKNFKCNIADLFS